MGHIHTRSAKANGMYRMHIPTPSWRSATNRSTTSSAFGTITKIAMENLMAQMDEVGEKAKNNKLELAAVEPGQIAVVTVSPGPGLLAHFSPAWGWRPSFQRRSRPH